MYGSYESLKQSEWYNNLPAPVKQAVDKKPPTELYSMDGDEVMIIAYNQNGDNREQVSVMVEKTGKGGFFKQLGFPEMDYVRVTGVKLEDLQKNV